ncbi:receptor-like protein EIX1 [Vicia villosa]|uniref:receptor-like protein EIX1 n=1 Tax=Vicia villosa TaxID=3911 RepID=UPI00273CB03C|nr:receptor-like protein EIX1 [Vicia villosa]
MPRSVFHFLFSMVTILWISLLCGESFRMSKCVEIERQALLKFKDAYILGLDNPFASWNGEDCCQWEGILCNNLTGHVTGLEIGYAPGIGGKLDSSICELQYLTSLSLDNNQLKGNIPECIGSLDKLIELDLSSNKFVGVVPPTLGNLSKLQTLNLAYNDNMSVNNFEWLSHLSNLRYLDLSSVNLTLVVDWLSSISKLHSLSELHLYNCGLQNVTLKSIPHLNSSISLEVLELRGNSLNSSILPWVVKVSKFVQYLDLSDNELQGSIPKPFRSMCQLKDLRLNSNKLSGQLSDNIQQLCCVNNSLEYLFLSDNPFTNESLPNLSCFSSLVELYLQHTNLVGMLPKSLFLLPSLQILDLSHNHLSGVDIIDNANTLTLQGLYLSFNQLSGSMSLFEITKLTSLHTIDLSYNPLSGPIPHTIGRLYNLTSMSFSSAKLNGVINETHLSKLSQLNHLDLSQNSLSFNLSSDWVPPFKLGILIASSCLLGPKFPIWLQNQTELTNLDISNTGISDSFPKWFWNLSSNLEYLNVSDNKLIGPLPKSFPSTIVDDYYNHRVWDLSFNNLNGSLPPFPELLSLFLSNNMFTGSLSSFCTSSAQYLIYLDLSNNFLNGELSDCWWNFQSLIVLNLARNNLSGKLPDSFGALQQIESLYLNNNNFFGEITSLIPCQSLKLIDVGDNNLQGTLPMWIGHDLPMLIVMRLRANKFQGNIPTSMCNLSFLQVLDLSMNNITGSIPQCFGDLIALSNSMLPRESFHHILSSFASYTEEYASGTFYDKEILALKGSNREYKTNLGLMTTIDLSCNHITGEIPQSMTKLVALIGLNLSGNNLTGSIPNNFGHMKSLESLDLSRNHLFGRIPTSFSNLNFLSYMNLSFNNLEGEIPQSTQLQSFDPSSFVGNDRLCGPPLINLCHDGVISPTRSHEKHVTSEDEDKFITFGFYVSLGLGFIIGFWGVCGTLVIKTSWRHAYFKFFNNISDWIEVTVVVCVIKLKRRFQVEG